MRTLIRVPVMIVSPAAFNSMWAYDIAPLTILSADVVNRLQHLVFDDITSVVRCQLTRIGQALAGPLRRSIAIDVVAGQGKTAPRPLGR